MTEKLIRGRTSNSQQVPIGELARVFAVEAGQFGNEELSISVSVQCLRSGDEPAGSIVVPQARITWGGDKGGSTLSVDCDARVNIDGCATLVVDATPSLFSVAPVAPVTYTFFVTLASGSIALPQPNQFSMPPHSVASIGGATPLRIPRWAKALVVPLDVSAFPAVGQVTVSLWASPSDYPGGRPVAAYTVDSGATVPIPGQATAYTVELAAAGSAVASVLFQLRI